EAVLSFCNVSGRLSLSELQAMFYFAEAQKEGATFLELLKERGGLDSLGPPDAEETVRMEMLVECLLYWSEHSAGVVDDRM
ncbi:unnamed protein product, partial [Polarella glacialis]